MVRTPPCPIVAAPMRVSRCRPDLPRASSRRLARNGAVDPGESSRQIAFEVRERPIDCRRPRDNDIVKIRVRRRSKLNCRGLQAPADQISDDGLAHLLGYGEAKTRARVRAAFRIGRATARLGFHDQCRSRAPRAPPHPKKICSPLQCQQTQGSPPVDAGPRIAAARLCGASSSRQALAALGSPTGHDPGAARRLHALAKSMAPLANETARLVGALHVISPSCSATREVKRPHQIA